MSELIRLDGHALRTDPTYDYQLDGRNPYDHQRITEQLFDQYDQFVGMNTAPTGGGKTDSWTHITMDRCLHTIAFYPRNSLVSDQKESIKKFHTDHYENTDLKILDITGSTLAQAQEDAVEPNPSKGDVLSRMLSRAFREHDVVIMLTNPDIFVNMYRGQYANNAVKSELNKFEVAVSDEFHMCRLKERNTLLSILEEMYMRDNKYTQLSAILFLSATPERALHDKLDNYLAFNYQPIQCAGSQRPLSAAPLHKNWRAIMPPVNLRLRKASTFRSYQSMFSEEQLMDTLQFINDGESVLVMLDGFNEVNKAYNELKQRLGDDLTIRRISGFHGDKKEIKLGDFDVLVSNSAVEVGIDFDIDRLLFSAPNASSGIQRLGRLRGNITTPQEAVCYIEGNVVDMVSNLPETDGRVSRPGFEYVLRDTYQTAGIPDSFSWRYSAPEAFHHAKKMAQDFAPDNRETYQEEARQHIRRNFFLPHGREIQDADLHRMMAKTDSALMEALQSYRSDSLQTVMYDVQDECIRTYNPISLIKGSVLEFVPEDQFYSQIPTTLRDKARSEEAFSDGFGLYYGDDDSDEDTGDVGLVPSPQLRSQIAKDIEDREPIVTKGLQLSVDEPGMAPGLKHLNADLANHEFICYPKNGGGGSKTVVDRHDLGSFFPLYDLHDVRDDMLVALGHDALYLHCHVLDRLED